MRVGTRIVLLSLLLLALVLQVVFVWRQDPWQAQPPDTLLQDVAPTENQRSPLTLPIKHRNETIQEKTNSQATTKTQGSTKPISEWKRSRPRKPRPDVSNQQYLPQHPAKPNSMNILVIYPDDWRHDDLQGLGPVVKTPFLSFDLARRGIRFDHNCVTTSVCWVSRATYFTGQWASRHQSWLLKQPPFYDNWNQTWPSRLRQAGYFTGHIGKWQYEKTTAVQHHFFDWFSEITGKHSVYYRLTNTTVHQTDVTRDRALEFLRRRPKHQPFSLTVAFYPPKAVGESNVPGEQWRPADWTRALYNNVTIPPPLGSHEQLPEFLQAEKQARKRFKSRFEGDLRYQESMKRYYALMTQVDASTKEIIQELDRQGIRNNTLIIFTTDNGFFHGEKGWSGKWYPYEESIRVPLIMDDPRMPEAVRGTVENALTLNVDLSATILGAAGLPLSPRMQGRDMADLYLPRRDLANQPWRTDFFYEWTHPHASNIWPSVSAVVRRDYKYMMWHRNRYEMLFHVEKDPQEEENLVENPQIQPFLDQMRQRYSVLKKEVF